MPDARLHILSTRPLPAPLIGEAANHGITIEVLSFIETRSIVDDALAVTIGELAKRPIAAIFTSSNALEAVAELVHGAEWKVYCIGQETKRQAIRLFGEKNILGNADSAAELAEVIISAGRDSEMERAGLAGRDGETGRGGLSEELVFFCGDVRREELPQRLAGAGLALKELVVYETRQTPHKVDRTYDGIAFFSPSAVEAFFSVNKAASPTALFAIGRTTALAIHQHSDAPVIVSSRPDKAVLIGAIFDHFNINDR